MSALDVQTPCIPTTHELQQALTLGWTISELFGRLQRMRPRSNRRTTSFHTLRRFSFANQDLDQSQRLIVTMHRVNEVCDTLELQPPPLPNLDTAILDDRLLHNVHQVLEQWSVDVQIELSGRSDELGRAFTYGGSFADTCWAIALPNDEAFSSGRRAAKELLRSYRVHELQRRMDIVTQLHNQEVRDVLHASLQPWIWSVHKERWITHPAHAERFIDNLQRQAEIWRELIVGTRTPLSFVSQSHRRRAGQGAWLCSVVLVLLVAVGLGLLIYWGAQSVMGILWNPSIRTQLETELIETISTAVSLFSMLGTTIAAFVSRASVLVGRLTVGVQSLLLRHAVRAATTVKWNRL